MRVEPAALFACLRVGRWRRRCSRSSRTSRSRDRIHSQAHQTSSRLLDFALCSSAAARARSPSGAKERRFLSAPQEKDVYVMTPGREDGRCGRTLRAVHAIHDAAWRVLSQRMARFFSLSVTASHGSTTRKTHGATPRRTPRSSSSQAISFQGTKRAAAILLACVE